MTMIPRSFVWRHVCTRARARNRSFLPKRCFRPSASARNGGEDGPRPSIRSGSETDRSYPASATATAAATDSGGGAASSPEAPSVSGWSFARDWNEVLARNPQAVLAAFLSGQGTTWLGLYAALSASGATIPASLAAGWMASKLTKKFRQPLNVVLAAGMIRVFPQLAELKVTPLVTGVVVGDKDRKAMAEQWAHIEKKAPVVTPLFESASRGARWLEGPVDKYGLSFYLSSRIMGVTTVMGSAFLIGQGIDVGAFLAEWGLGEGIGEAAGTAAGAAVGNFFFIPFHFYSSVYGVRSLEGFLKLAAKGIVDGRIEAKNEFRRRHPNHEHFSRTEEDDCHEEKESEYEQVADGAMKTVMVLLLAYAGMISFYSFRLVKKTASNPKSSEDGEGNSQIEEAQI